MHDLAGRLANRVQLTTDAHRPYLQAVEDAFGTDIDYAQLVKIYGSPETNKYNADVRYAELAFAHVARTLEQMPGLSYVLPAGFDDRDHHLLCYPGDAEWAGALDN